MTFSGPCACAGGTPSPHIAAIATSIRRIGFDANIATPSHKNISAAAASLDACGSFCKCRGRSIVFGRWRCGTSRDCGERKRSLSRALPFRPLKGQVE